MKKAIGIFVVTILLIWTFCLLDRITSTEAIIMVITLVISMVGAEAFRKYFFKEKEKNN